MEESSSEKISKYEYTPENPLILDKYTDLEKIYQVRGFPTIIWKIQDSN